MKNWKTLLCFVAIIAAGNVQAQDIESLDVELQSVESNGRSTTRSKQVVEVEQQRVAPPNGGVWIVNSQGGSQASNTNASTQESQLVNQPTTYVEASPLSESRADEIRKARQGAEINTEQRIVEKLEESRLKDEKRRAQRLFGNRWDSMSDDNVDVEVKQVQQQVQSQPQVIQVVPVHAVEDKKNKDWEHEREREARENQKIEEAKSEIISEIRSQSIKEEAKVELKESSKVYVGGTLGVAEYSDVGNMQGNGAAGVVIGTLMPNGLIVEGSFLYSNYYIDEFWMQNYFKEMDQYNFNMAVKYSPLKGMFQPIIGGTAGYTYRNYTDRTPGLTGGPSEDEIATNAVDLGILVGLDLALTDSFTLGTEYRYSRNLVNRSESDFINRGDLRRPEYTTPIEELDYYMLTVNGKFTF